MTTLDFDKLLHAPTLHDALTHATGKGVNVALLDTGIDETHPDLVGTVIRAVDVISEPQGAYCHEVNTAMMSPMELDPVGHGTACAGIIHAIAPEAKLISVRVIGASAAGTGQQFVRGLEWALEPHDVPVHVANLSLGTLENRFSMPLRRLVDQAYFQNIMLVAAGNNMGMPSYPAIFPSLIAVDNECYSDPMTFEFRVGNVLELSAHGIYVRAPKAGGGYQLWTGTSFACPHITGLVARLLSINHALTPFQIKTLLHALRSNRGRDEAQT